MNCKNKRFGLTNQRKAGGLAKWENGYRDKWLNGKKVNE